MPEYDEQNLDLTTSTEDVDRINTLFYETYTFPWQPVKFEYNTDPDFERIMLNQSVGDWSHTLIPQHPKIWVAGCGTNQAIITALKFPKAQILGTDLSSTSLSWCSEIANNLGISNLELKQDSILNSSYKDEFDYIICTGVVHHTAYPELALTRISEALKPTGILELMVYNRFHRLTTSAFQKAITIMSDSIGCDDLKERLKIAKKLISGFSIDNLISSLIDDCKEKPDESIADTLIQPVEHSYTVDSLNRLSEASGLEMLMPVVSVFDKVTSRYLWHIQFDDEYLQKAYDSLVDLQRRQVANLLLFEKSPMLWFYFQRKNTGRCSKSEKQVCNQFLNTRFEKVVKHQAWYSRNEAGCYEKYVKMSTLPATVRDPVVRKIIEASDGQTTISEICHRSGIELSFSTINRIRIKTTTTAFPYLKALSTNNTEITYINEYQVISNESDQKQINILENTKRRKMVPLRTNM